MAPAKKILVSGATGFIGTEAVAHFQACGCEVIRLSRCPENDTVVWDPSGKHIDPLPEDLYGVVHLAGENIVGRWTTQKKDRIYSSRIGGTKLLAEQIASLKRKPKVLVCASAIGFYGDRGDTILTEQSPTGSGFLSRVCRDWETAAEPARQAGIRTVHLRIGMVLSGHGGPLDKMLPMFRMGLGGRLGSGRQWVSWVTLKDILGILAWAMEHESLTGPVNTVAPQPVQNHVFTRALAGVLHRPAFIPVPAFALRTMLGDLADETLLASTRAIPEKLRQSGFHFEHPDLEQALTAILT